VYAHPTWITCLVAKSFQNAMYNLQAARYLSCLVTVALKTFKQPADLT
jgi:hypothetical protein